MSGDTKTLRTILNVPVTHLARGAQAAKAAMERPGGFPPDGFLLYEIGQSMFVVKRNKASVSVWVNGEVFP